MALIANIDSTVIFCVHRDVIVVNLSSGVHSKFTLPVLVPTKSKSDTANNSDEDENGGEKSKISLSGQINRLTVSSNGELISVATIGDKALHLLKLRDDKILELLSQRELARATSEICFTPDSNNLLVADKTGDGYLYECVPDANKSGKWLLGHYSMVLDVLMTPDSKFIITCDRDEKIRVTNYPTTEEIEMYCLGHLEFVPTAKLIPGTDERLLLSISGDQTLRLWNYLTGEELLRHELPAPGIKAIINDKQIAAVVLLTKPVKVILLKVLPIERQVKQLAEYEFDESVKYVNSLTFETNETILVATQTESDEFDFKKLTLNETTVTESSLDALDEAIRKYSIDKKIELLDDASILFKKKFDNLTNYHERKRRRIEKKQRK